MEKTMKIEGMMCEHCEARVKKTLEAIPQVDAAEVSYKAGTASLVNNIGFLFTKLHAKYLDLAHTSGNFFYLVRLTWDRRCG